MNRADRRAAAKKRHPSDGWNRRQQGYGVTSYEQEPPRHGAQDAHYDCGCAQRTLVPMEPWICPDCGQLSELYRKGGFEFPTGQEVGSLMTLEVGCVCGTEFMVRVAVE